MSSVSNIVGKQNIREFNGIDDYISDDEYRVAVKLAAGDYRTYSGVTKYYAINVRWDR